MIPSGNRRLFFGKLLGLIGIGSLPSSPKWEGCIEGVHIEKIGIRNHWTPDPYTALRLEWHHRYSKDAQYFLKFE